MSFASRLGDSQPAAIGFRNGPPQIEPSVQNLRRLRTAVLLAQKVGTVLGSGEVLQRSVPEATEQKKRR